MTDEEFEFLYSRAQDLRQNPRPHQGPFVFDRAAVAGQHARNQRFVGVRVLALELCSVASPALKPTKLIARA